MNLYGFVGNDGVNLRDYLGLAWTEVPGSFVWIKPLTPTEISLNFKAFQIPNSVTGAYQAELIDADVIWKGTAKVTCRCKGIEKDAAGNITAEENITPAGSYMYSVANNVPTPWSGKDAAEVFSIAVSWAAGLMPASLTDEAISWDVMMEEIKSLSVSPGNLRWDNHGRNPCQALKQ